MSEGLGDPMRPVPVDSGGHAGLQGSGGLPVEAALGLRGVQQDGEGVVRVARPHFYLLVQGNAQRLDRGIEQLLDGEVGARGDVVNPALAPAAQRSHHYVHQIVHEDEVAASIHDEAGKPVCQPMVESRQRTAQVSWAVCIGQPEGNKIDRQ